MICSKPQITGSTLNGKTALGDFVSVIVLRKVGEGEGEGYFQIRVLLFANAFIYHR